jgi:predicted ATPase/DNA-binding CsgD family transcriptional regulator
MAAGERMALDRTERSPLPVTSTPLVGREPEVARARERLLDPHVRLLTFTGPGGTGKTRLALAVAASLADRYVDGVHFVDLAPVRDPLLVHGAIAHAFGIQDAGDQPLLETLRLYLRPRHLLLVLDNFEQVIEAAALVADLLAACPPIKIIVTSREPLHLTWEHEWLVSPLALPPPAAATRHLIVAAPAVTLFVERARASKSDFALTDANAPLGADICRRLDGLPLAIELAAARVKLLPLAAIHARLQQRLLLLTGGPRDAPARHQTLRAAIAWSYDLLNPREQTAFRRLAIFVGGFTTEAAEGVLGAGPSTLDLLQSLLDKNLIRADATATAEPRFRMLETIREFALEELASSGELELVQERHARFFLAFAEAGDEDNVARIQGSRLDRLEVDHDNLLAVLGWSLTAAQGVEIGARLAGALELLWQLRGHFSRGRAWYERLLAREDDPGLSPRLRARLLWVNAFLAWRQGDYPSAIRDSERGIALSRSLGDGGELPRCLAMRALVACHQAQYAVAHALLDEGLQVAHKIGDDWARAVVMGFSSLLACLEGDYPLSRSYGEESLRIFREQRNPHGIAMNLDTLGVVARRQGQNDRAQALHDESLAVSRALGDKAAIAVSLANLGHVARAVGDDPTAQRRYSECLQLHREVGDRRGVALALGNLGALAERAGDHDAARNYLDESLTTARAVGDKRMLVGALNHLARLALARGDGPGAAGGFSESLLLSAELQDKRGVARTLEGCATLLLAANRPDLASELCVQADGLLDSLGAHRSPFDQAAYNALRAKIDRALVVAPHRIGSSGRAAVLTLDEVVERARALLESSSAPLPRQPAVADPDNNPLSRREREIAILIARGLTNRAIGEVLVIAERTAETHVSNILAKLRLETRSQIAVWAVERRLTALP